MQHVHRQKTLNVVALYRKLPKCAMSNAYLTVNIRLDKIRLNRPWHAAIPIAIGYTAAR